MYSTTDPSRKYGERGNICTFAESQVRRLYSQAMSPPRLLEQVRSVARVKHSSLSTEKAYVSWIRRFILFHHKRHPSEMAEPEIREFLSRENVERQSLLAFLIDSDRLSSLSLCASVAIFLFSALRLAPWL